MHEAYDYGAGVFDNEGPEDVPCTRNPMPDMLKEQSAWVERNAQLRAAWVEWRMRMLERQQRLFRGHPPQGWWARNARRYRDMCFREYGAEAPEPAFIAWRNRKVQELGRSCEVDSGRQPWE